MRVRLALLQQFLGVSLEAVPLVPCTPGDHRLLGHPDLPADLGVAQPVRRQQHHPRPPYMPGRRTRRADTTPVDEHRHQDEGPGGRQQTRLTVRQPVPRRYVARGVPGGYRTWDNKVRRWWGDHYEVCPDDLLTELNGDADYNKITQLLKRYRAQKR